MIRAALSGFKLKSKTHVNKDFQDSFAPKSSSLLGFSVVSMALCGSVLTMSASASAQNYDPNYNTTAGSSYAPNSPSTQTLSQTAGRVSFAQGDAQVMQPSERATQWRAAMLNDVLVAGTSVWSGADGSLELRVGATSMHLGANTLITVRELDATHMYIDLDRGSMALHQRDSSDRGIAPMQVQVLTLTAAASVSEPGRYRFDANQGLWSTFTVLNGRLQVQQGSTQQWVSTGNALLINAANQNQYSPQITSQLARTTPLDNWAQQRDRSYEQAYSSNARYVSPHMTGQEELGRYGYWQSDTNYGSVWVPNTVASDWAPYRYGRWTWVSPWGWTWVDNQPWGFAPFHYGRWVYLSSGWAWWPGRYIAQPVYAPALVSFGGASRDWSWRVSFGAAPVYWAPLSPFDYYRPAYVSPRWGNNVTVINNNVTVINQNVMPAPNNVPGYSPGDQRPIFSDNARNGVSNHQWNGVPVNAVTYAGAVAPAQLRGVAAAPINTINAALSNGAPLGSAASAQQQLVSNANASTTMFNHSGVALAAAQPNVQINAAQVNAAQVNAAQVNAAQQGYAQRGQTVPVNAQQLMMNTPVNSAQVPATAQIQPTNKVVNGRPNYVKEAAPTQRTAPVQTAVPQGITPMNNPSRDQHLTNVRVDGQPFSATGKYVPSAQQVQPIQQAQPIQRVQPIQQALPVQQVQPAQQLQRPQSRNPHAQPGRADGYVKGTAPQNKEGHNKEAHHKEGQSHHAN